LEKKLIVTRDKFIVSLLNQDLISIINKFSDLDQIIPYEEIIKSETYPMPVTPTMNPGADNFHENINKDKVENSNMDIDMSSNPLKLTVSNENIDHASISERNSSDFHRIKSNIGISFDEPNQEDQDRVGSVDKNIDQHNKQNVKVGSVDIGIQHNKLNNSEYEGMLNKQNQDISDNYRHKKNRIENVDVEFQSNKKSKVDEQIKSKSYGLRNRSSIKDYKKLTKYGNMINLANAQHNIDHIDDKISSSIRAELKQMLDYKVWKPINVEDCARDIKIIPTKMFTVEKFDANGIYIKHKSRLVAGGHLEYMPFGLDTSSPTIRTESLMIILNIVAINNLQLTTIDVGGAFLEAFLGRNDIYVSLQADVVKQLVILDPKYNKFINEKGRIIVQLLKAMYGLKEASMEWYQTLVSRLKSIGFYPSKHDAALMIKDKNNMILAHVDDLLIVSDDENIEMTIESIKNCFNKIEVHQENESLHYIGMVIERNRKNKSIKISQPGYIKEIISHFELKDDDIEATPCNENLFKENLQQDVIFDLKSYQRNCMKLMYLSRTRPDIKLPLAYLSTKLTCATQDDETKLLRVAKYINGTQLLGLILKPESLQIYCSADASFAIHSDYKSQSGLLIWLGNRINAPIHSQSKKQKLVTMSSTESEMVANTNALQEVLWSKGLLEELGHKQKCIEMQQDNKSTIVLGNRGPGRSGRSRSINIRYFWISQHIQEKTIQLTYVATDQLLADGLTKPLPRERFIAWRNIVLNIDSTNQTVSNE